MTRPNPRPTVQLATVLVLLMVLGGCSAQADSSSVGAVPDQGAPIEAESGRAEPDWREIVHARIADGHYRIRANGDGEDFWAVNRAHNLRARFGERAVSVSDVDEMSTSRSTSSQTDKRVSRSPALNDQALGSLCSTKRAVMLRLARFGRGESLAPVGAGELARSACPDETFVDERGACIERLDIRRDGVTEWWHNRPDGLEQGFTVDARPAGDGTVVLEMIVEGATVNIDDDAQAADLVGNAGWALRYDKLRVWDARGETLTARLVAAADGLAVHLDDTAAHYPITIDPLLTNPGWTAEGDQETAKFGAAISSAGDVNGDGFDDVIVGAYQYDTALTDTGQVFLYRGSSAGLSNSASWTADPDDAYALAGHSVSSAGDVNGDGFDDVIVGTSYYSNGQTWEGRADVYHGSPTGLSDTAAWTVESDRAEALLGHSVSGAGDVNGDGFDDVIVGARFYDNGQYQEGAAFVYHGSPTGLSDTAAWAAEGDQSGAEFGQSVSGAGDVDGDGFDDVIVGAQFYNQGRVFVYHGTASGLSTTAAWTVDGVQQNTYLGHSVGGAGDVNGDGFDDVIVGTFVDNNHPEFGRAFVYYGSGGGLSASADWTAGGIQKGADFGDSVDGAGDVNGDGFDDVIVGAHEYDNGQSGEGRAVVFHGAAGGLSTSPAWTAESDQNGAGFGRTVSGAGDVDGDGYDDVIIGADDFDNGQIGEGRVFVYHGAADNRAPMANEDTASTDEDTPVTVDVLANDSDPDGDPLTVLMDSPPSNGVGTVDPSGAIEYVPDAGFSGQDVLVYRVTDPPGKSATAKLTITVRPSTPAAPCEGVQCTAGQACYSGTCFESCSDTAECSNPQDVCYDQRCAADPCEGVQCAPGQACYSGTCFESCSDTADCSNPRDQCYDQHCAADPCEGVQCAAENQCYQGTCFESCSGSDCAPPDDASADAGGSDIAANTSSTGGRSACATAGLTDESALLPTWIVAGLLVVAAVRRRRSSAARQKS